LAIRRKKMLDTWVMDSIPLEILVKQNADAFYATATESKLEIPSLSAVSRSRPAKKVDAQSEMQARISSEWRQYP
jgi:hypothetical protein